MSLNIKKYIKINLSLGLLSQIISFVTGVFFIRLVDLSIVANVFVFNSLINSLSSLFNGAMNRTFFKFWNDSEKNELKNFYFIFSSTILIAQFFVFFVFYFFLDKYDMIFFISDELKLFIDYKVMFIICFINLVNYFFLSLINAKMNNKLQYYFSIIEKIGYSSVLLCLSFNNIAESRIYYLFLSYYLIISLMKLIYLLRKHNMIKNFAIRKNFNFNKIYLIKRFFKYYIAVISIVLYRYFGSIGFIIIILGRFKFDKYIVIIGVLNKFFDLLSMIINLPINNLRNYIYVKKFADKNFNEILMHISFFIKYHIIFILPVMAVYSFKLKNIIKYLYKIEIHDFYNIFIFLGIQYIVKFLLSDFTSLAQIMENNRFVIKNSIITILFSFIILFITYPYFKIYSFFFYYLFHTLLYYFYCYIFIRNKMGFHFMKSYNFYKGVIIAFFLSVPILFLDYIYIEIILFFILFYYIFYLSYKLENNEKRIIAKW